MNKYQEALTLLFCTSQSLLEQKVYECKKVLQELVDKETPMKVNEFITEQDPFNPKDTWQFPICPNCKDEVCESNKYCNNCGQKIYFKESEE